MTSAQLEKKNLGTGARIREARKAQRLSKDKLAELSETNPAAIEKLENSEVLLCDVEGGKCGIPKWAGLGGCRLKWLGRCTGEPLYRRIG